jgi:uncharacterized protein YbjT (DUF2867 family)
MTSTILVTGATGSIGRATVQALAGRDVHVRLASRDAAKLEELRAAGYDAVRVDFAEPLAIAEAVAGVDALLLVSSQHPDQTRLQGNVVTAAAANGVRHVVKVSGGSTVTGKDAPSFVGRSHWEIEQQIASTGLDYTFLRPNYFMQNLLNLAAPIVAGTLPMPLGEARMAIVDVGDVGAVAATILADPKPHAGEVYDITGPEAVSFADIADRMSTALGTEVRHVSPPIAAVVETLKSNGTPDWLAQHVSEVMEVFSTDPDVAQVTDVVERVTGRPAASIDDFIARHAAAFRVTSSV